MRSGRRPLTARMSGVHSSQDSAVEQHEPIMRGRGPERTTEPSQHQLCSCLVSVYAQAHVQLRDVSRRSKLVDASQQMTEARAKGYRAPFIIICGVPPLP